MYGSLGTRSYYGKLIGSHVTYITVPFPLTLGDPCKPQTFFVNFGYHATFGMDEDRHFKRGMQMDNGNYAVSS